MNLLSHIYAVGVAVIEHPYYIIAAALLCLLVGGIWWTVHCLLESALLSSPDEIARREYEQAVAKANKEFKQRQRLLVLRIWNIFN